MTQQRDATGRFQPRDPLEILGERLARAQRLGDAAIAAAEDCEPSWRRQVANARATIRRVLAEADAMLGDGNGD